MNIKSILSIIILSSTILTSCKKELKPQDDFTTTTAAPVANAVTNPAGTPMAVQAPNPQMQMQPNMVTTTVPAPTAPGMNPPHGQPNHRCDIAVGAPLSTPKAAAPQQNQVTTQVVSTTPAATVTPAAVNPDGTITPVPAATEAPAILQAPVQSNP
ncbi:MAG: hypothetical protein V4548_09130 [Bacteroidota bacterium]